MLRWKAVSTGMVVVVGHHPLLLGLRVGWFRLAMGFLRLLNGCPWGSRVSDGESLSLFWSSWIIITKLRSTTCFQIFCCVERSDLR